ncbi:MAG TPA: efflux RND transporter periplasmic adaptor subunit [Candidatus Aminicenantes bacterium]|nr:efflux RND transporter periplasmic adaptor subunit [Candidatus Aminicenantes bacterium]
MNKKKYLWMAAVASVLVVAAFFVLRPDKDAQKGQQQTVTVTRKDVGSNVLATGVIKPMVGAEVRVGSRVSGLVKRIYANVGDFVEKGQIIAELDPAELQAKYSQALANQRNTAANFDYAKLDLARQKSLIEKKYISQNQVDLAEKAFEVAKAQLEQARANLEYARVQLDYTKITAPITGIVASVSTQEGETVAASFAAPTFVTIIDLDRLEVWAYVDETDIGRIKDGQVATFSVDTYSNIDFKGVVTAVYPKAVIQDNVVNYVVTLKITDHQGKTLRPEMSAKVSIFLETRKGVLTIPLSAIHRQKGQSFVTVMEKGKPVARKVETGWTSGGMIEVTSGLDEGETVLVSFE